MVSEAPSPGKRRSLPLALLVAARPHEWIKNLLVFAGLLFSGRVDDPSAVLEASLAFAAFCAVSSAGYLFNDLRDAERDRLHPTKYRRPIAAGELPANLAVVAATVLASGAVALAWITVSEEVGGLVAAYAVITAAYTIVLKRLVIIDVMTIASLFIIRVVAGAVAVGATASEFLLVCTAMLALFLGFTKRRQEATDESRGDAETRPVLEHYSVPFLDQMVALVTAAAIISYIIYAVDSPNVGSKMLATAPSVLYGVFRYLYLVYDRKDTRSTASILTHDPGMIFAGVSWVVAAVAVLYLFD